MEWYEGEVRELERAWSRQRPPKDPVVFYGSSTIRLWTTLASDLDSERVVNLGFGGSTLEACAHFFERLVPPLEPCSLVVYAGDNDLGDGQSPQAVLGSFRRLAAQIERQLPTVTYTFISIKPSPARVSLLQRIGATNTLIKQEIAARKQAFFVDCWPVMLDANGQPQPGLFEPDGLHLNRAGYEAWSELLSWYRNRIFTTDCSSIHHRSVTMSDSEARVPPLVQSKP